MASARLSATLSAPARDGKLTVLSSPRLTALNNQKAILRVSDGTLRTVRCPWWSTWADTISWFRPEILGPSLFGVGKPPL